LNNKTTTIPHRIQRKRTKGWKMPRNTVYVGRGSKWGNPFVVSQPVGSEWFDVFTQTDIFQYFTREYEVKTHEEAVGLFKKYFTASMSDEVKELRGKNLACWCKPGQPCHADVLMEMANKPS